MVAERWPQRVAGQASYRVEWDESVYRHITDPQLADLDVLDADGVPVPSTVQPAAAGAADSGAWLLEASGVQCGTALALELAWEPGNEPLDVQYGVLGSRTLRDWGLPAPARPTLQLGYRAESVVLAAAGKSPYALVAGSTHSRRGQAPISDILAQQRARHGRDWQPAPAMLGVKNAMAPTHCIRRRATGKPGCCGACWRWARWWWADSPSACCGKTSGR